MCNPLILLCLLVTLYGHSWFSSSISCFTPTFSTELGLIPVDGSTEWVWRTNRKQCPSKNFRFSFFVFVFLSSVPSPRPQWLIWQSVKTVLKSTYMSSLSLITDGQVPIRYLTPYITGHGVMIQLSVDGHRYPSSKSFHTSSYTNDRVELRRNPGSLNFPGCKESIFRKRKE